jgi:hypothetical protein
VLLKGENKSIFVKSSIHILFVIGLCSLLGCKTNNPSQPPSPAPAQDTVTLNFQIRESGIRPLRTGEFYVAWVKIRPDTSWQYTSDLRISTDSNFVYGKFSSREPLDSIQEAVLSIERTNVPLSIGLPLQQTGMFSFDSGNKHFSASFTSKQSLGDFSALQGSLVFTSTSPDSLEYTHEFYLMNIQGSAKSPSLLSLAVPPMGWKYGLWALDSNFTPREYFFYGLFSSAKGHDSDSTNDFFPYPGGRKPQQMNMSSGSIIVTLEPEFYSDSLKNIGPSTFTLLRFDRIRFIEKDKNYPMTNVAQSGVPNGTITFWKN